jgi:hypothetical protein
MNEEDRNYVSNIEALVNSIRTDKQVFRWFLFLIVQPPLISRLSGKNEVALLYDKLKRIIIQQRFLFIGLLIGTLALIALQKYLYLFGLALFIYPIYKFSQAKQQCVAQISEHLLRSDFEENALCTKTLYQICEIYSRQHNIPSLVDAIYVQDNVARKTIIYSFVFTAWIYPLANIWAVFIAVILAYHIISAITQSSFIFKYLK